MPLTPCANPDCPNAFEPPACAPHKRFCSTRCQNIVHTAERRAALADMRQRRAKLAKDKLEEL